MPGVTAEILVQIDASLAGSNDLGTPKLAINRISELIQLSGGTSAANQADLMFTDTRTLAASATENLDVAGALADAFGTTLAGAEVVALYIKAAAGNTNNVNVTRPASNGVPIFLAAGDGVAVKPGEYFLLTSQSGIAVTAATGDLITITNSGAGTAVTYNVLIIARTVAA